MYVQKNEKHRKAHVFRTFARRRRKVIVRKLSIISLGFTLLDGPPSLSLTFSRGLFSNFRTQLPGKRVGEIISLPLLCLCVVLVHLLIVFVDVVGVVAAVFLPFTLKSQTKVLEP